MPSARQWTWCLGVTALYLGAVLANAGGVFAFGIVAAWRSLRSSSIWPPTAAHSAHALLAALLVVV